MRPIKGSSVVVTGGGSGLGEGIARHFVARGARVTICGRRPEKIASVAADLGEACRALPADVVVPEDRQRLVAAAVAHGGGIDTLVHAAGNMYRAPIEDLDEATTLHLFHTNVVGPMRLTAAAVPYLRESRGLVLFFGSVHVVRAFPGASAYAATKGALEALTGVLAAELGPAGIRVGCVRPGAVFTEINTRAGLGDERAARQRLQGLAGAHALGRIGTAEEVAEAVAYLAGAEWTTGGTLVVDGGLSLGVTNA
jgi:3-oxoacyl-[acyl-carrier protein] reductase